MPIRAQEDRLEIPRRTSHALVAASICRVSLEGMPLLSIGLLVTVP